MRNQTRANLVLFGLAAFVTALDQATKIWIRRTLLPFQSMVPVDWLEPYVIFTRVENPGAAFGLGQEYGTFLVIAAFFAVGLIVLYFRRFAHESWLLRVALGLQLGGALGNLIDRLAIGAVTDFINLGWFPIFNVADSAITVGSVMLAYYALFLDRPPTETAEFGEKHDPVAEAHDREHTSAQRSGQSAVCERKE